jgi:hypothetical protein
MTACAKMVLKYLRNVQKTEKERIHSYLSERILEKHKICKSLQVVIHPRSSNMTQKQNAQVSDANVQGTSVHVKIEDRKRVDLLLQFQRKNHLYINFDTTISYSFFNISNVYSSTFNEKDRFGQMQFYSYSNFWPKNKYQCWNIHHIYLTFPHLALSFMYQKLKILLKGPNFESTEDSHSNMI